MLHNAALALGVHQFRGDATGAGGAGGQPDVEGWWRGRGRNGRCRWDGGGAAGAGGDTGRNPAEWVEPGRHPDRGPHAVEPEPAEIAARAVDDGSVRPPRHRRKRHQLRQRLLHRCRSTEFHTECAALEREDLLPRVRSPPDTAGGRAHVSSGRPEDLARGVGPIAACGREGTRDWDQSASHRTATGP